MNRNEHTDFSDIESSLINATDIDRVKVLKQVVTDPNYVAGGHLRLNNEPSLQE